MVIHHTFEVVLVVMLVFIMHNANPAAVWSNVASKIHSSYWPFLLHANTSSKGANARVKFISILTTITTVLLAIASIITPLGLQDGPLLRSPYRLLKALYVADSSPLGLATPSRAAYTYGRICGALGPLPCPGNDTGNTTQIAQYIIDIFTSTTQGPFNLQFRRFFLGDGGYNYPMALANPSILESLVLNNGTFAVEGLIVDMTQNPGIGLWNNTIPAVKTGGTWSEDVLWLEPVSSCVNTNLTVDYLIENPSGGETTYNVTDRGGIFNLTTQYPEYSRDGQDIDIYAHAYKGAVLQNFYFMVAMNLTARNQSYNGRAFDLNTSGVIPGTFQYLDISSFIQTTDVNISTDIQIGCEGFGGTDTANVTNVSVHCALLLGPPVRTDGGDPQIQATNSTWSQAMYVCAGTTRASIQTVTFSFNGTASIGGLQISRQPSNASILWAVEKSDIDITDVDLYWGRINESYQDDPTLWTVPGNSFYIPAGSSDVWSVASAGQPNTIPGFAWASAFNSLSMWSSVYSGENSYALLNKWQTTMETNPNGASLISNWIWTDIAANNLVGSATNKTLLVSTYEPSVSYQYEYGIPALILFILWSPSVLAALLILLFRGVRLQGLRYLINQTSFWSVALGKSSLKSISPSSRTNKPIEMTQLGLSSRGEDGKKSLRQVLKVLVGEDRCEDSRDGNGNELKEGDGTGTHQS